MKIKIKVGDNVKVISGSSKGKEGKIIKVLKQENKVLIEKINIVKKHVKPNGQNETGGIIEMESPIHVSNVRLIEKKEEKKTTKKKEEKKVETKKETKVKKESKK